MQTIAVQIQDNYMPQFINYVKEHSSSLSIIKDKNLELDPYFYTRQKRLHKIRDDIHNGNMRLLSQEESDNEIEQFFEELENNQ